MAKKKKTAAGSAGPSAAKMQELTKRVEELTVAVKKKKKKDGGNPGLAKLLGKAGTMLGGGISKIMGFGDYVVQENSMAKGGYSSMEVPSFGGGSNEVRVTHREFVRTIAVPHSPTDFHNITYDINPSNDSLFPWLSKIARNYQQYKINGMVLTFKSMTSEYASSGSLGTVGIATNYNVNDKPFADLVSFENSQFAVVNKPSLNIVHAIECKEFARNGLQLYVRDAQSESTGVSDARFYDFAKVQIMTDGLPQGVDTTLGQLWVSYDITLLKPIVASGAVVPTTVSRTVLRSQASTTALQWLDQGDVYRDTLSWSAEPVTVASQGVSPFSTALNHTITGTLPHTFNRSPTDLTLLTASPTNGLRILRNGDYTFTFVMQASFAVGKYNMSNGVTSAISVTNVGGASSTVVVKTPYTVSQAPISYQSTPTVVIGAFGQLNIKVRDIVGVGGAVDLSIPGWVIYNDASNMPSSIKHELYLTWSDHANLST